MNDGPIVRRISFDIHGEFITQLAREWFYTGEKSHEKVIEILMDSMTGTDTPEAQIRRYAEDILLGRAALKGSTAAGTYHLETYEPGEEEQMPQSMNIWKEVERRKKAEKDLRRMIERWDVAMDHISESTQKEIRKELGEETAEDRQQDSLDSFMKRMMDEENHTTEDYGWLEPDGTFHGVEWGAHQEWAQNYMREREIEEFEEKLRGTMEYWGCGGPYNRQEEAIERRKKQLDELDDFAMQLNRAKKHETVRMWIFGCRSCGSITMVNRQPFDDWHECPVCRQMVHLNSLPSKEFEIVDTGETWQEQIKRAAEEGNSWQ